MRCFVAGSVPLVATPALAQHRPGDLVGNQVYATDLLGKDVYSSDNARIGAVADLIVDPASGLVAVLETRPQPGSVEGPWPSRSAGCAPARTGG